MANIQQVQCGKMNIQPGDKILVRTKVPLSKEQTYNLRRSIERWAGDGVPVLFVDENAVELKVIPGVRDNII